MTGAGVLAVGVDAGGTKTDAVVCDGRGDVLGFGRAGSGNWEMVGTDEMAAVLADAVGAALEQAGVPREAVTASAFALAGVDWPADIERLDPTVAALGLAGERTIVNDAFAALRAGCRERHGAVSIAGTGTVSAARNRAGETFRTMAIGYGERGGGGDLVRAGLDAIARSRHGQAPPTLLEPRYLEALGLASVDALFEALTRQGLRLSPHLARVVLGAADDGDEAACTIAREIGLSMGAGVAGVARVLGMQDDTFEVVCAGGVHAAHNATLSGAFRETLAAACPHATPVELHVPPAAGAALLALELVTTVGPSEHDRIAAALDGGAALAIDGRPLSLG